MLFIWSHRLIIACTISVAASFLDSEVALGPVQLELFGAGMPTMAVIDELLEKWMYVAYSPAP